MGTQRAHTAHTIVTLLFYGLMFLVLSFGVLFVGPHIIDSTQFCFVFVLLFHLGEGSS